ncbi:MAG TPA: TetR/AcrR family transcriptional regulator [Anaerolineaceae bacterium]|nr:TetR/AcrR family transcriptional regulator [Anaerolineaceae bacterium]
MSMPVKEQDKKVDPRVKRTRKLLEQAFMELMYEKGFQSITIQDVTERATVNRATFYAHFEDKYDLLDSFIREQFVEWLSQKAPISSEFDSEHLCQLVVTVFEFLADIHQHCSTADRQIEPMFETAVQDELNEYLLAWFNRLPPGLVPPDIQPAIGTLVWSWAIFGAGIHWVRRAKSLSADEMAAQVTAILLHQ